MKGGVLPGDGRHDLYLVFAVCYWDDQIKEDEIGVASSTHGRQ